jgi:hypothetical protein
MKIHVNHISLTISYRILNKLHKKTLGLKYSLEDVIKKLSKIQKTQLGKKWMVGELTRSTKKLCESLDFSII